MTRCQAQSSWILAPDLADGLSISNPQAVGLNEDSLRSLLRIINETPPRDFRALTIIKDGNLVLEEYFNSFAPDNIHDIRSAGKSITALCAGIAMDQGLFKATDPVFPFFTSSYSTVDQPSPTVRDLLIMSSGLASDDYDSDSPGTEDRMIVAADYLDFILDLGQQFEPGSRWAYSSAVAFLLGALVEVASGRTLEDFAREHLFGPLGITELYWQKSPQGRSTGMGNLYLRSRDLAKLGFLMLNKGTWKGQRIISQDFVENASTSHLDISDQDPFAHGYGYMWYIATNTENSQSHNYYFASGNGGNKIFIFPDLNMVVTTMSSAYGQGYGQHRSHNILSKILQALDR